MTEEEAQEVNEALDAIEVEAAIIVGKLILWRLCAAFSLLINVVLGVLLCT